MTLTRRCVHVTRGDLGIGGMSDLDDRDAYLKAIQDDLDDIFSLGLEDEAEKGEGFKVISIQAV